MNDETSDEKHSESDPERTLITLDQLSQTIEVMTAVVNRLRQHLSEQLTTQARERAGKGREQAIPDTAKAKTTPRPPPGTQTNREEFIVEIKNSPESAPSDKNDKVLH